jgi:hypothetical protein
VVKVHPDLLKYYHPMGQRAALITETTSAWWSFNWGYPGFDGLGLEKVEDAPENLDKNRPDQKEPTQFHFPEGNGGIARLLVKSRCETGRRSKSSACRPSRALAVRIPATAAWACSRTSTWATTRRPAHRMNRSWSPAAAASISSTGPA